jgi:hypothetical protein
MSRFLITSLALVAAAFSFSAQAADGNVPGTTGAKAYAGGAPLAIGTSHKLYKSYFDTDASGASLAAGFNTIGTTLTLNCPNSAGCTIAVNANTQLAAAASDNLAAICILIDGSYLNCPFNKMFKSTDSYGIMNYQTFGAVALGNHTVDVQVYSSVATSLARWNKEVKIYKP